MLIEALHLRVWSLVANFFFTPKTSKLLILTKINNQHEFT